MKIHERGRNTIILEVSNKERFQKLCNSNRTKLALELDTVLYLIENSVDMEQLKRAVNLILSEDGICINI